jgi:hypothetical protein
MSASSATQVIKISIGGDVRRVPPFVARSLEALIMWAHSVDESAIAAFSLSGALFTFQKPDSTRTPRFLVPNIDKI